MGVEDEPTPFVFAWTMYFSPTAASFTLSAEVGSSRAWPTANWQSP
jgi:hypothetical protein